MGIGEYIKRVCIYIFRGIPIRIVTPKVICLAPNDLLMGRIALITGGTSGIGLAIAKSFLASGATVIITGRNDERLHKSCIDLNTSELFHNRIFGIQLDNTKVAQFQEKFDTVLKLIGNRKIDILVNNAGVLGGAVHNATEEEYDTILDTNLKGVFFLSQLVGRYMKENKIEGNILNVASSSSLRPAASAYTISKWGIRGLTLGLAKSLSPYGIIVNGVAPGPTATPMLMKGNDSNINMASNPIGRYALPEEIANMAVVLVSNLGRTIVGDIVYMTGGAGIVTFDDVRYSF